MDIETDESGRIELPELKSNEELYEWLESAFELSGWDVFRNVAPDRSVFRMDMIVNHSLYGQFGIVKKYNDSDRENPMSELQRGFKEITEYYWDQKYCGEPILRWVYCPYDGREDRHDSLHYSGSLRGFLWQYGIGFISTSDRYKAQGIHKNFSMKFGTDNTDRHIPISPKERYLDPNLSLLDRQVKEKRAETKLSNRY